MAQCLDVPAGMGWMDDDACSAAAGLWSRPILRMAPGEQSDLNCVFGSAQFSVCFNADTFAPQSDAVYGCIGAHTGMRFSDGRENGRPLPTGASIERSSDGRGANIRIPPPPSPPPRLPPTRPDIERRSLRGGNSLAARRRGDLSILSTFYAPPSRRRQRYGERLGSRRNR
jgi:hypothetical protein